MCCLQINEDAEQKHTKKAGAERYSRSVDSSTCPRGPCPARVLDRRGGKLEDKCRTGWSLHPADTPRSSPGDPSRSRLLPLRLGLEGQDNKHTKTWLKTADGKLYKLCRLHFQKCNRTQDLSIKSYWTYDRKLVLTGSFLLLLGRPPSLVLLDTAGAVGANRGAVDARVLLLGLILIHIVALTGNKDGSRKKVKQQ